VKRNLSNTVRSIIVREKLNIDKTFNYVLNIHLKTHLIRSIFLPQDEVADDASNLQQDH
jgi:hypothetical protein